MSISPSHGGAPSEVEVPYFPKKTGMGKFVPRRRSCLRVTAPAGFWRDVALAVGHQNAPLFRRSLHTTDITGGTDLSTCAPHADCCPLKLRLANHEPTVA